MATIGKLNKTCFQLLLLNLVAWPIWWLTGWGRSSRPAIRLGLLGRECCSSFIGDISTISSLPVNRVGHLLQATIGQRNIVGSWGFVPIPVLSLTVVVVAGIILDQPVKVVDSWASFWLSVGLGSWGSLVLSLGSHSSNKSKEGDGRESLFNDKKIF